MSIRPRDRFLTFKRDNFTCRYCGRRPPEVQLECDHVIPRAKGGADKRSNYVTSCHDCNSGKGAEPLQTLDPNSHLMRTLSKTEQRALAEQQDSAFLRVAADTGIQVVLFE